MMTIISIVIALLGLLATVIIGTVQVTWTIAKDVFRDKPRAKHYAEK